MPGPIYGDAVYKVVWSAAAIEDLFSKVQKSEVAEALLNAAQTSLNEHSSAQGGEKEGGFWLRAPALKDSLPRGAPVDKEQPANFIIVYRKVHRWIRGEEYIVLAVVSSDELTETLGRIKESHHDLS